MGSFSKELMKRLFITGASAGIGLHAARALCARGHEVWGTGRTLEKLPVIERFHPVVWNLNDKASVDSGFRKALCEAAYFDVLINNAGAGVFGPLEGFSDEEFTAQLETLLLGPLRLIRLILPDMRMRRAGLIINVSSLAGDLPLPFMAPYSLSKAALSAMSDGLNLELAHSGIRVVDVRPGDFATDFHGSTRRIGGALALAYSPHQQQAWNAIDRNMSRAQNPQRVAELIVNIVDGKIRAPVVAIGDIFQARIAPLLARFSPRAWVLWGLRGYYGLKKGA